MSREELEKRLKDVKDRIKMIDVELEDEEYPVEPEERIFDQRKKRTRKTTKRIRRANQ